MQHRTHATFRLGTVVSVSDEKTLMRPLFSVTNTRPSEANRKKQYGTPYTNVLYADGHAAASTVRQLYDDLRHPIGDAKAGD